MDVLPFPTDYVYHDPQIGRLLAHCILFWGPYVMDSLKVYTKYRIRPGPSDAGNPSSQTNLDEKPQPLVSEPIKAKYISLQSMDRHFAAMTRYSEAPWYWYSFLLVISFFAGLIVVLKGGTTLPVWGYIIALLVGCE